LGIGRLRSCQQQNLAQPEDGLLSIITAQISLFELTFGSVSLHHRRTHIHPLGEGEFFGTVFKTGKGRVDVD